MNFYVKYNMCLTINVPSGLHISNCVTEEKKKRKLLGVSPALLLHVCGVHGGRAAEQRHFTGCYLSIQSGVCVDERLDQLCGGPHLLLNHRGTRQFKPGSTYLTYIKHIQYICVLMHVILMSY